MIDSEAPIEIRVARLQDGTFVFSLRGELDVVSVPQFESHLAVVPPGASVVIDLSELEFIDSSGLNSLLVCGRREEERGTRVVLAAPLAHVAKVFAVVRLDEFMSVEPSVDDAIARLGEVEPQERAGD
jgi:anti-sigma B factor antagonist